MQVRYRYRIYPTPRQQQALARVFGCARVVYNDCLRVRDDAYAAGEKITDTEVQRRVITQRVLSRRQKGSANRARARHRVAIVHRKVRNARLNHAHKTALRLVRDNQAVYAEDLCVSGLARTRLAKSVSDAGWSQLLRCIEEKAVQYGRMFAKVGRFEPTSQVCSACGVKDGPKPLGIRRWVCAACGTVHDRDVNAARNILALGRRERLNACGTGVRPPLTVAGAEAGTRRNAA